VTGAIAFLVIAGLLPVAIMFRSVGLSDLSGLIDARTLTLLGRTLQLGLGATAVALLVGVPFGFFVTRTDIFGRRVLRTLGIMPLLFPPLVIVMTWTVLVELRGAPMTILMMSASTFPFVALFAGRAFERIDARQEEAARLVGGFPAVLRMQRSLILPPALCGACLAFIFAINDFAVPDFVSSVGPKFNVYADEIFASWQIDSKEGKSVVTALPLVTLTLLALIPVLRLRRRGAFATIGSGFRKPSTIPLGAWRIPATLFCLTIVSLSLFVPIGRLIYEAGGGTQQFGFDKVQAAFTRAIELCRANIAASLMYALATASIAVPLALILGHAVERTRHGAKLEWIVILPLAFPAILFGIGNITLWNNAWSADFYAGGGLVILMYVGRFAAFPTLISSGAVASLDPRLEDAAELGGAGPITRLTRIVAPNIRSSLIGGWILMFVLAMRELDTAILVPAANKTAVFRLFNAVHFGRDDFVAALALLIIFVILLPGVLWALFGNKRLEFLP